MLFWGVREMKRVNLTTVDRPQVDIDCAGQVVTSTVIANAKKNPNFSSPITFFDVVRIRLFFILDTTWCSKIKYLNVSG